MKFKQFYYMLNQTLSCYHPKYIKQNYVNPKPLSENIPNTTKFRVFLHKLITNKFKIWCTKGFSQETLYYDYILPTAVFLHYMRLNIDNLSEFHLYIVNEKTYELYNKHVGGEYLDGINPRDNTRSHLILVKQFNPTRGDPVLNEMSKNETLNSLFHELTHLVDNVSFNRFSHDLAYCYRPHEIKAKVISRFFSEFYKALNSELNPTSMHRTIWLCNHRLHEINLDLNVKIAVNNRFIKYWHFNIETYEQKKDVSNKYLENIQLYTSLRQINTLKNFLTNFEERIK